MSKRTYPRFDSRKMLSNNTTASCRACGCTKNADREICMQVDYMRGNDEFVKCCAEHAATAHTNPKEFCAQFPADAWK